jgi:hypothetical protein
MSFRRRRLTPIVILLTCAAGVSARSFTQTPPPQPQSLEALAAAAIDEQVDVAMPAMAKLRDAGQTGVDALWALHGRMSDESKFFGRLDAVCGQKDCAASRLYWFKDLDRALAEAKATHRPILSLRLLGNLDDELTCANSRFFRTILYSDPAIADYVRTRFVLHWQSERPVPRVTIDFGDGRQIQTTITGNSIHYVLDENGTLIDALPGLYGPQRFRTELERIEAFARTTPGQLPFFGAGQLSQYHRQRSAEALTKWTTDMKALGSSEPLPVLQSSPTLTTAVPVMTYAITKAAVERPLLRQWSPVTVPAEGRSRLMEDPVWARLAEAHLSENRLSPESEQLVRQKYLARQPAPSPESVTKMLDGLRHTLAIDTLRNEYLLRRTIHGWLSTTQVEVKDLNSFNETVYSELFGTPRSDPWLGLLDDGVFSGLPGSGATAPAR